MSDRARAWCLRHAESENVATGTPPLPATPLSARGNHQASAVAWLLAAEPIVGIYSSTAVRAWQTAAALATVRGCPVTAVPELAEARCTADILRAWVVEQDLGQRGSSGETGQQVVARVTAALQRIASVHPGETVALVGHVASLTVTLGQLCSLGHRVWGTPLPHARPFLIEWDGNAWHCPAWPTVP